jgi:rRNA processing protein Krr1/Pno1
MTPEMLGGGGAYGGGAYGGYQQAPGGYGAAGGYQAYQPVPQPVYNTQYGGQTETDVAYAPKQLMGRIIGQKGVTINDIQKRSGCELQVNQNVPAGQDCEISIRGNRQGIEIAKQIIREIIEIGPGHPYAGGADSGFGSRGGGYGGGYGQQQGYDYQQQPYVTGYDHQQQPYGGYPPAGGQYGGYGQPVDSQQQYGYPQQAYGGGMGPGAPAAGAPAPAPAAPPATAWKSATTPEGQVYYYNETTGESRWEKPPGMM